MEFRHKGTHGTIKRFVIVEDGPVIAHPGSSTGKRLRVEHASLEYKLQDGEWVIDSWSQIHVTGTVLKTDGSDSKVDWGGTVHFSWEKRPEYRWLHALVEGSRPEGVPALPFRMTSAETDGLEAGA